MSTLGEGEVVLGRNVGEVICFEVFELDGLL